MRAILNKMAILFTAVTLGTMAGCGGGGGGGGGGSAAPAATTIAGTASKGIVYPGSVSIYALDANGAKSALPLKTVATDSNGLFTADIGVYSGAIVAEVSGSYTDEASGSIVTIDAGRPLRAAINAVTAAAVRRFAVTPLTDLAYSLAGTPTPANITAANARVSTLFKISDITSVEPVKPTSAAMSSAAVSQQTYTLALSALSQMAKTANPATAATFTQIDTILTSFKTDLAASAAAVIGTANTNSYNAALGATSNGTLKDFYSAAAAVGNAGSSTLTLTLSTSGIPNGTLVGGISGKITFPAGSGATVSSNMFALTGNGATSTQFNSFTAPVLTFGIINAYGFAGGGFATLTIDVTSGSPTAASFVISDLKIIDKDTNDITGATVTIK